MALDAIKAERTLAELAKAHDVHPNVTKFWNRLQAGRYSGLMDEALSRAQRPRVFRLLAQPFCQPMSELTSRLRGRLFARSHVIGAQARLA